MRKKADHNMLCPLFFLLKINEGRIGYANPQFFASAKRFDSADIYTFWASLKLWVGMANLKFPCRRIIVDWQKQYKI
jgi:hypothetical protein